MNYPAPIVVNLQPSAAFTTSDSAGCMPFSINFTSVSSNLDNPVYIWDFGNGAVSSQANPQVNYTTSGIFDISLSVTNSGGCHDEAVIPQMISIYDPAPPDPVMPYSVSVNDSNSINVKWKAIDFFDIDHYDVYRMNNSTGIFQRIASVSQPVPTGNVILAIDDMGVDTRSEPYSYKIQAVDKCSSSVSVSLLTPHTSVFLTAVNNGANIDLSWSAYGGCPVAGYNIYRADGNSAPFTLLGFVYSNTLAYRDTSSYCPFVYYYKVEAFGICGESGAKGISNISSADHSYYTWQQTSNVTRATVVNNDYVLIEWLPDFVMHQTVTGYDIFRSTDSINYNFYRRVPAFPLYFEDKNVNVQRQNYYYRVSTVNFCETVNPQGNKGSSILLKGDYDKNGKKFLKWSPYKDWVMGVDHYTIEKLNAAGVWEFLKETDAGTTEAEDQ
jgi:PKD repeat protein